MPRKYHSLKAGKVRADWSKENLYNLSRLQTPPAANKTFFQQKWLAKSMTRAFHNPYVREGSWTRMFDRRLPAVVPMDHRYLAKHDGSERASGRGSGVDVDPGEQQQQSGGRGQPNPGGSRRLEKTPYMHMTFHPLERRLDTAIWRALFSSSVKQARQMVTHGWAKVNGKKMIYPGYQLNPGDMFTVDPERVMYATGARKRSKDSPISTQDIDDQREAEKEKARAAKAEGEEEFQDPESEAGAATLESDEEREALATKPEDEADARKAMKNLVIRAKRILEDSKRTLSGRRQQELRAFAQSVRKTMSKYRGAAEGVSEEDTVDSLETALAEIMAKIPNDAIPRDVQAAAPASTAPEDVEPAPTSSNPQMQDPDRVDEYKARQDAEVLAAALERARANPVDASKPYATPWRPREYMSAFAFIPRYLEVNQNICAAVYLRHPVARLGLAEVPTPFNGETLALAFNWYLRRR